MTNEKNQALELQQLEEKLETLIQLHSKLKVENSSLKVKQEELVRENSSLIEKNSIARTKVEAMITR